MSNYINSPIRIEKIKDIQQKLKDIELEQKRKLTPREKIYHIFVYRFKHSDTEEEEEEFKGEKVYETREGRLKALNHIIGKYIEKTQGHKTNYKENVPMSMDSIIEIIENDVEFRKFTFDNYRVFIHNDENDRVHVRKITYEMEELIKQHEQNLDDKEFQDKLFSLEDDLHAKGRRRND